MRAADRRALRQLAWPAAIAGTALVAAWLVYFEIGGPLRAVITLGFLLVCPGMAYVRLLRLSNAAYTLVLALALSLALDLLVAVAVLYSGHWSPMLILGILIELCLVGVLGQVWSARRRAF